MMIFFGIDRSNRSPIILIHGSTMTDWLEVVDLSKVDRPALVIQGKNDTVTALAPHVNARDGWRPNDVSPKCRTWAESLLLIK